MYPDLVRLDPPPNPEQLSKEELVVQNTPFWFYYAIFSNFHYPENAEAHLEAENYSFRPQHAVAWKTITKSRYVDCFIQAVHSGYCRYHEQSLWKIRDDGKEYMM